MRFTGITVNRSVSTETPLVGLPSTTEMPSDLVSEKTRLIFQWVVYGVLIAIISSFGMATNIINIICFAKQGLQDPVNVSLLGLGISDLGCLMTLLAICIGYNPAFHYVDLPMDIMELLYLPAGWPHAAFFGVSSWLTALITLERCLCITMPLKVKSMVTPKRVTIIIVSLFIILFGSVSPIYYANRLVMRLAPKKNRTVIAMMYTSDRAIVDQICFAISNVFIPFSAYFVIIISTVTLVIKLRQKAKWRIKCTASGTADTISERDQRVAKMVLMVSTLFIICFSPLCLLCVAIVLVPGLSVDGRYKHTMHLLGGISTLLESTNSASNIFIYYHMSSKYRVVFRQLFCWDKNNVIIFGRRCDSK